MQIIHITAQTVGSRWTPPKATIFDNRPIERLVDMYTPKTQINRNSVNPAQKHRIQKHRILALSIITAFLHYPINKSLFYMEKGEPLRGLKKVHETRFTGFTRTCTHD